MRELSGQNVERNYSRAINIKMFDKKNIELYRKNLIRIFKSSGELIDEHSCKIYIRDSDIPQKVKCYKVTNKDSEPQLINDIDLTYSSDKYDIATLDGAEDMYDTKQNERIKTSQLYDAIGKENKNTVKRLYDEQLIKKINISKYSEGFYKSFPELFEKNPKIQDHTNFEK